jgi:hypothetical protein
MKSILNAKAQPTKRQTEKSRAAIRVTQIINRLQANFDGKLETPLTPTQVKSGQILLAKVLPDLSSATIEDVTPDYGDPRTAQENYKELLRGALKGMSRKEVEELLQDKPEIKSHPHETMPTTPEIIHKSEVQKIKRLDS